MLGLIEIFLFLLIVMFVLAIIQTIAVLVLQFFIAIAVVMVVAGALVKVNYSDEPAIDATIGGLMGAAAAAALYALCSFLSKLFT